jgi:hypothetical protein
VFPNPNDAAFVPVTAILVMETAVDPVLVMVTDCDALVLPTNWLPNAMVVADKETVPAAEAVPVPVTVTPCGEPLALSVTPTVAE